MLTIKGPSENPCFICGSTLEVRLVKLGKTVAELCMKHISDKTSGKKAAEHQAKDEPQPRKSG